MMQKKKNNSCYISSFFFLSVFYLLCLIDRSTASSSINILGVPPQDLSYYSGAFIKCKDGSKKFKKAQLNDDFCDCPGDGTDEPGTSACPNGKFYCTNAGHIPVNLHSSRVNDGICDCCDGSDEYDGKIKCPNTCWEAGKMARDRLKKKITTYNEGVTLRRKEIEQSKLAAEKDAAELSKLKNEEKILKGLVQQLQDRKEQIEKAEEKERLQKENERLQKEKEEKEKKDLEDKESDNNALDTGNTGGQTTESTDDEHIGLLEDSPPLQDVTVHGKSVDEHQHGDDNEEAQSSSKEEEHTAIEEEASAVASEAGIDTGGKGDDASDNTESLSKEELGHIVGSRWTGKKSDHESAEADSANDDENHEEQTKNIQDEEYNSYESETEDEHSTYDDDEAEDHVDDLEEDASETTSSSYKYESDDDLDLTEISSKSNPSWLEKIQKTVRNILQAVNLFQTPVDKSEAARVRKEYDELNAKLSKIQSKVSSLTQKVKHDFGSEKEFYSLYGQCLELKQNKYVYKVCPFKQATQEEGHGSTRLGSWDKFEDSYRIMRFSNGDKCWNGPDRSLTVRLRCGLKNEITDVDEPSRCEYEALLSTPVLCLEEKLKELQDKLDLMNKEQPQGHDEL